MIDREIIVNTPDGPMSTFVTHPSRGGPHPVVLMYIDAGGTREELRDMARRIGTVGYYVAMPDLFHRSGDKVCFDATTPFSEQPPEVFEQVQKVMAENPDPGMLADIGALADVVRADPAAREVPWACIGYCMGGRVVLRALATYPELFAAGVGCFTAGAVTDGPDSAHLDVPRIKADVYLGFGGNDPVVPLAEVDAIRAQADAAAGAIEIEIQDKAGHGFIFSERRGTYRKDEAEVLWERTFELFDRTLRSSIAV